MHKLFMKLFGWKYIVFKYGYDYIVRKVTTYPSGVKTVTVFGSTYWLDEQNKLVNRYYPYVELN